MFHPIASIAVFQEFVRCQTGIEYKLFFLKDYTDLKRKEGDILYDAEKLYIYKSGGRMTGPFESVFGALDYWMEHVKDISMPEE